MGDRLHRQQRNDPRGLLASLLLHVAFAGALFLAPTTSRRVPPPSESIAVDILTPLQFETETRPSIPEQPAKPSAVRPPDRLPETKPPELSKPEEIERDRQHAMIRAAHFFSAKVLGDPRSKKARAALAGLATDERMIQVCDVEALQQVHAWKAAFQPDALVAYAMADVKIVGRTVEVAGGAFRSGHRWYEISFNCEMAPDADTVAAFEFQVGGEIPRSEWDGHNLSADGDADE